MQLRYLLRTHKGKLRDLAVLLSVNVAVAGIGFFTQIRIANVLGKESFGLIAFGFSIATFAAVFIRFGSDRTLVRDLLQRPEMFAATVRASVLLRFTMFSLFVAVLLLLKFSLPTDNDFSPGVILVVIAHAALSLDLQGVYDSRREISRHATYNLFQKGVYFGIIWGILVVAPNVLSVLAVGVAALVAVFVYLALQYRWVFKRLPRDTVPARNVCLMAVGLARGNVVVIASAVGGLLFGPLNQVALKHYSGAAELGGYAAAWMMTTLVSIVLTQVGRVGNPATVRIATADATRGERLRFLQKYAALMVAITLPLALPAILAPTLILETFFRPEYASAAPVLRIMGIYVFIVAGDLVALQYLMAVRSEGSYLQAMSVGGVVGVFLCLTLIPLAGAIGAAWALVISHGLAVSLYWVRIASSLREAPRFSLTAASRLGLLLPADRNAGHSSFATGEDGRAPNS